MAYELKDYLSAINETKKPLLDTDDFDWERKFPPFVINKCLAQHYDTIMHANEMNGYHFLPKKMQFDYLLNSIRERRRFGGKWLNKTKVKDLEGVKEYYGYSNARAQEVMNLLSKDHLLIMKQSLEKGGRKKR